MKILFLYTEIAGYFLACVEALLRTASVEVMLVRWPVNVEAPFDFDFPDGITVIDRKTIEENELEAKCIAFSPDVVFVTGWLDKGYLKIAQQLRKQNIPVIAGMDNQWNGSLRQRIATWISPWYIRRYFDFMWVAGLRQYEYARRLGFAHDHIRLGYYSADVDFFQQAATQYQAAKSTNYPHTFLYVGRLIEHKGIDELCAAFMESAEQHNWRLRLVGKGEVAASISAHPRIEVLPFVQPEELPSLAAEAGAFVLPSREEPWGVVVHEFAAGGLPLVISDACGAGDAFLRDGFNGFRHRANHQESLKNALLDITRLTDSELLKMGQKSTELALQITPEQWAQTLISLANA